MIGGKDIFRINSFGEILFDVYPNRKALGGAPLNFIYHISKLTGSGVIISRLGADSEGEEARKFIINNRLEDQFIQMDKSHPTGRAIVNLNSKKEPSFKIEDKCAYDFIEQQTSHKVLISENTDCLYFGTLAQRNQVSRNTLRSFFNQPIKYFCDLNLRQKFYTKEILLQSLNAANILKLNINELKIINEIFLDEEFELIRSSNKIMEKFKLELLAVTRGADGAAIFTLSDFDEYKVIRKDSVDTLGAGDAFAAILCTGFLSKWDIKKINELANRFAGDITMVEGALPTEDSFYNKYKAEIKN